MSSKKRLSDSDFEALVSSLQDQSFEEAKNAYGDIGFERWRNPKLSGPLEDADCQLALTGKCGDTIQLFLKFNDMKVEKASYTTTGCASSQLAGSFTAELSLGRTAEEIFSLTPADVLNKIGKLPDDDQHCTDLAIQVLHECTNNYLIKQTAKTS
ncbi:MAG: iron-sulfur cluster assembly scaffold protein [Desulfotalea sp.]